MDGHSSNNTTKTLDRVVVSFDRARDETQSALVGGTLIFSFPRDARIGELAEGVMHARATIDAEVLVEARADFPGARILSDLATQAAEDLVGMEDRRDRVSDLTQRVTRLRAAVWALAALLALKTALLVALVLNR